MKRESKRTVGKLVLVLVLLLCGAIGARNLWAQATAAIIDKSEIAKAFSQMLEVKIFIENLIKKADEKKDLVAKECLLPLLTSAQKMVPEAEKARVQAEKGLGNNDMVEAGKGIENIAILREIFKNLFGEALTCLAKAGTRKDWQGEVVNLIQPLVTFSEEELLTLPEPSLEPTPWLSIYR